MGVGEEGDLVLCYLYKMLNLDSTSFDMIHNSKNLLTQRKHSGECNILQRRSFILANFSFHRMNIPHYTTSLNFIMCVCGGMCIGFWLQSRIYFGFYPGNWGHIVKRGYPQILIKAVYSITGAIGCVKASHLAIGGNVASCPVKSLNSIIIYRSTGGHYKSTRCTHLHGV